MEKERLTTIILSLYLILSGVISLFSGVGYFNTVLLILSLAAGILILITTPRIATSIGWQLAGTYFILIGLELFGVIRFQGIQILLSVLALLSGILFLVHTARIKHRVGFFLFCIWLVLVGLMGLIGLAGISLVVSVLAVAAGVLMLLDK